MNKKWLLKEIKKWQSENIIDADAAGILSKRYEGKGDTNVLTIIFSVLGSLLIGAGIILILVKNWYLMPTTLKTILSVLPMLIGQGLAIFTVLKRKDSLAWREGVAVFYSAGVFTALAMVSQTFHIAGDYGNYILACGLLCLPIIYLLNAVTPLAVYFFAIISWGFASATSTAKPFYAFLLLLFFALGLLYVFLNRKDAVDIRHVYTIWVSVIAGGVFLGAFSAFAGFKELDYLIVYLIYFAFLFALDKDKDGPLLPFKSIGALGSIVLMMFLSFEWGDYNFDVSDTILIALVPLAAVGFLGVRNNKFEKEKLQFLSIPIIFTAIVIVSSNFATMSFIAVVATVLSGVLGIGLIVKGAKSSDLPLTNLGLIMTCVLILFRFFDENIDFLWRGVAFLILGGFFLLVNFKTMRNKKKKTNLELNSKEAELN